MIGDLEHKGAFMRAKALRTNGQKTNCSMESSACRQNIQDLELVLPIREDILLAVGHALRRSLIKTIKVAGFTLL